MTIENDNIFNKFDWENFNFPLSLSEIQFEEGFYNFKEIVEIKIWRDNQFKLVGEITGYVDNEKNLEHLKKKNLDKDIILKGENFVGKSDLGERYKLRDCLITSPSFTYENKDYGITFKSELSISSIVKYADSVDKTFSIIDWNICSANNINFPRFTTRYENIFPYKFRTGINEKPKTKETDKMHSLSRDFFILQIPDLIIIIQKIDDEYLPNWTSGISIEYRNDLSQLPTPKTRRAIAEFISFMFGIQLLGIGSTLFNKDLKFINSFCYSPWGNNVISNCSSKPYPPIDFYQNSEIVLSKLLSNYLSYREKLDLEDVLWKLWIGRVQSLGTNLPILASGIDTLAVNYIKEKNIIKKYSKTEKKKYRSFIKEDLENLTKKIKDYQFGQFIINKINNPFNFGVGEKIKLFLNEINFEFDNESIETKALIARNKMAHGSMSNISKNELIEYLKLTNAYITIYNRILLKVLDYDGHYIDYYNVDNPRRKLNENILIRE
ncbi:hypothetical protein [Tenacibaculum finnmarkense]|uniref:hypothetical protein n=1 Tax=Tenacibaculum finnmarkense TaxID=2781243 RepID=UPI001EFA7C7C|nr:hypothetical protein [Tenacibaculum finnmarkense]MCG8734729.1 hypothetical protein [Tenacibaculum finnmarkense]